MPTPLLAYDHVGIAYDGLPMVHDVSFELAAGEVLGIVGESGSGKSTLLKAALELLGPTGELTSGSISYDGCEIGGRAGMRAEDLRGDEIGMVFQDCLASLTPTRKVGELFYEEVRAHREDTSRNLCDARAAECLSRLEISDPERILGSYPFELSGGLGQRVGIALAMVLEPKALLADEPTSALDVVSQKQVAGELKRLARDRGVGIVLVTHNIALVRLIADGVLVLKEGRTVEYGPVAEVLSAPKDPYTRALLDAVPKLRRGDE